MNYGIRQKKVFYQIGYFVGNFFGTNDGWKEKEDMFFLDNQQVLDLFKEFDVVMFKEIEKDAITGLGKMKHWHIFDVIARKIAKK